MGRRQLAQQFFLKGGGTFLLVVAGTMPVIRSDSRRRLAITREAMSPAGAHKPDSRRFNPRLAITREATYSVLTTYAPEIVSIRASRLLARRQTIQNTSGLLTVFQSAPRDYSRGDETVPAKLNSWLEFQSAPRDYSRGDPDLLSPMLPEHGFNPRLAITREAT